MRLTDIYNNDNQIRSSEGTRFGSDMSGAVATKNPSFVAGNTITGELVSRNGNEVTIRVNDSLINAKIDQSINLEVGKNVLFQVKSNSNQLVLNPLNVNVSTDVNIMRALNMASLPINEETIDMTKQLMEAGLPIDKNSLSSVYKELSTFSSAETSDIVALHKMNLPVNENNVSQMSSYRNLSYQLIDGFNDIAGNLKNVFAQSLSEGNYSEAVDLFKAVNGLVMDEEISFSEETNSGRNIEGQNALNQTEINNTEINNTELKNTEINDTAMNQTLAETGTENATISESGEAQLPLTAESFNALLELGDLVDEAENSINQNLGLAEEITNTNSGNGVALNAGHPDNESVNENLDSLRNFENTVNTSIENKAEQNINNILKQIISSTDEDTKSELVKQLNNSLNSQFEKLLTKLKENWTLAPEDLRDEGKISETYKKLNTQLRELASSLENMGKENTAAFKSVDNMSKNIDFLEQVNQAYTYVQLPLKLNNSEAHGDLYVYTNKRNLAAKDGEISALLHLDMEHLGPVDVYVAMQNTRVNTMFYLSDDDMLDFINDNIHILNERLSKKGYALEAKLQIKDKSDIAAGGVNKLLEKEGRIPVSELAFDVRT